MRKLLLTVLMVFILLPLLAQENSDFGITWSGFVKNDFFFDSRQTVAAREGHFLLWPSPVDYDPSGEDINAKPNFNFLAVQSRLKAAINGPDAFGAKTSGVIEADFFAQANANINLLRLRHAYIKMNWERFELLAGQYWNPLFVTSCFPGTVSFNTGAPLQSFARNPQIRASYSISGLKLVFAALSQRDYTSRGPAGVSSDYLRNSAIPDMHFQLAYSYESDIRIDAGAGIAYKSIVPRLSSTMPPLRTYKVDERVGGLTAIGFFKAVTSPLTVKTQVRYGENIPDVLSISGFAVKDVADPITGELNYTPLTNLSFWGEIHTNGSSVQAGVFGGVLRSLGTKDQMSDPGNQVYGLGTDIYFLYRLSPRLIINSGKVRLAFELEYTSAAYGSDFDLNYIPQSVNTTTNIRVLTALYYFF